MSRQIKKLTVIGLLALAVAFGAASGLVHSPSAPVQLADPGVHGGGTGG